MDIANILIYKFPNSPFSIGETYESLIWMDKDLPKPTLEELKIFENESSIHYLIKDIQRTLKEFINSVAQEREYNDEQSLIGYFNSSVQLWKNEATIFINWRDSVWNYAIQELAKLQAGDRLMVSASEFITELPLIIWPN